MLILPPALSRGDLDGVPLRQAKNFTRAMRRRGDVLWVVLHSAECAEVDSAAENLAAWASGPQAPRASWHYCLTPESRVLHADLTWRPLGDTKQGDELLACCESGAGRNGRILEEASVTKLHRRQAECVRVTTADGRVLTASRDHRFLARRYDIKSPNRLWIPAEGLREGDILCAPLRPWSTSRDRDWGYLAGILDGEGTWHTASTAAVSFSQKPGAVLHEACALLDRFGIPYHLQPRPEYGVTVVLMSGLQATLEILGVSRPLRLMAEHRWLGRSLRSRTWSNALAVESIETVGAREVVALETSTHTYISEGLISHNCVDSNSVTQSVLERDVAWHAPGANARGIGVEHAGRAGQLASGWDDLYSHAMLALSAALVAGICRRWDVPVQRVGPAHLKSGTPGICGHDDVSKAFKKSSHWDPGPSFPWDAFLDEVQRFYRKSTPTLAMPRS